MRKDEEQAHSKSCFNRAKHTEMIFVLLARDKAAPETIREWCRLRISLGLNRPNDDQIKEAYECARLMTIERDL